MLREYRKSQNIGGTAVGLVKTNQFDPVEVFNNYSGDVRKEVYLFLGKQFIKDFAPFVNSNDLYFSRVTSDTEISEKFLHKHKDLIYRIDRARVIDYDNLTIDTPYGTTNVSNFSTGLKTILNSLYLLEYAKNENPLVNISECGDKAINYLLRTTAGSHVHFYLTRYINIDSENFDDAHYFVNKKRVLDSDSALNLMWDILCEEGMV